jgi:hypothetical protein
MNPGNPWVRLVVSVFAAVIAIQLLIAVLRPLLPAVVALLALIGAVALARWWRDRW